ncbi:MAG: succinate dehydrogenase assembly factor 2 [Gammaproteobacteria bacterium]|nr:succinate dehydrogenase assembly factor 2 [Gammaproteobacteria bacterium]MCF6230550.1 succinate dehydrogenase assembly factor 2 [Gammaproteobacteria bacterium]
MSEISRLQWQCRRSMLELELLLRGFLDSCYEQEDTAVQSAFVALLALSDQTLQELLFNEVISEEAGIADVVERIKKQPLSA